ncbi:MAG: peroxidase, partial [Micromonosporaceae bacterium]|nr:peroxidase [Micromonosporaceae bacterium]
LDYLRDGPFDGNPANNAATLMLPGGYLPTTAARGGAAIPGPQMAIDGRLRAAPNQAMLAGDVRANENIALTATHTMFAREHNRIVGLLPNTLTDEEKFQIARRVVIAEQQFITYNEFLPAAGVRLAPYTGYKSNVNPTLSQEFATVGYRAHSQIHGEFEVETERARYSAAQLASFAQQGISVEAGPTAADVILAVPLNVAFFNPNLLKQIGLGPMIKVLSGEAEYKNDFMIDNHLRSVLFQVPKPGRTDCIEPVDPACFTGVVDLGAIDIERGRDHGIATYNNLRREYGLAPKTSFSAITGESEDFPTGDPKLLPGHEIFEPASLDVMSLTDKNGANIPLDSPAAATDAVNAVQRTTSAARLKAIYNGDLNSVDAFAGMISERHLPGSEFGELQNAIWAKQFTALRDGDRFFYGNSPVLDQIRTTYGIDFRRTLAQVIASNTDIPAAELQANVFKVAD